MIPDFEIDVDPLVDLIEGSLRIYASGKIRIRKGLGFRIKKIRQPYPGIRISIKNKGTKNNRVDCAIASIYSRRKDFYFTSQVGSIFDGKYVNIHFLRMPTEKEFNKGDRGGYGFPTKCIVDFQIIIREDNHGSGNRR